MKPWSVEECEVYAKQLRDKTRANTAEHAAQAIEYLLGLVKREWVGLTEKEYKQVINAYFGTGLWAMAKNIEAKLKEKNNG